MSRTTAQLIKAVRDEVQIYLANAPLYDGYSTDVQPRAGVSILDELNKAYRKYVLLGFSKCYVTKDTTAGTREYRLAYVTSVLSVDMQDASDQYWPVKITSRLRLRRSRPSYMNDATGTPRKLYFDAGIIGLWPVPDAVYTLTLYGDVLPTELAIAADIPSRLDDLFHDALPISAAKNIMRMSLRDPRCREKYIELKAEEKVWEDSIREVAHARDLEDPADAPQFHDARRAAYAGLVRR